MWRTLTTQIKTKFLFVSRFNFSQQLVSQSLLSLKTNCKQLQKGAKSCTEKLHSCI